MEKKHKRDRDGLSHSRPGSVDQQSEDTFPASDAPSFSPGAIGAPGARKSSPRTGKSGAVKAAEKRVRSGAARKHDRY